MACWESLGGIVMPCVVCLWCVVVGVAWLCLCRFFCYSLIICFDWLFCALVMVYCCGGFMVIWLRCLRLPLWLWVICFGFYCLLVCYCSLIVCCGLFCLYVVIELSVCFVWFVLVVCIQSFAWHRFVFVFFICLFCLIVSFVFWFVFVLYCNYCGFGCLIAVTMWCLLIWLFRFVAWFDWLF